MDVSIFPYQSFGDFCRFQLLDNTKQYLLKTIEILADQLKYIFIDGKLNIGVFNLLKKDYIEICKTKLPVNAAKKEYDLIICKHKEKNSYLMYYGCFLYGQTMPRNENVLAIANYIKDKTI